MRVAYLACAHSSALDAKTNRLSLFHVMDEIVAEAFPLVLPSFCVAALFEREAADPAATGFVLAVSLGATHLASFTMGVDFSRTGRNRSVNTIQGLAIPGAGLLTIAVLQKTAVLAQWRVPVLLAGGAPPMRDVAAPVQPPAAAVRKGPSLN